MGLVSADSEHFCSVQKRRTGNKFVDHNSILNAVADFAGTLGDSTICIAVLDGPVDCSHPCFQGAELEVVPTWVDAELGGAAAGHGTHVASIIFGQPGISVRGLVPRCRGLIVPIFGDGPNGGFASCLQLDLARAILIAVERGAHVINISGGQPASSPEPEPLLAQAIRTCAERNILIVSATGNEGCECLHVPAAAASVLSVGASDARGRPMASSNWGGVYQNQGIVAPGMDILGASPGGGTAQKSGTSFATAVVTGFVGLLLSLQVQQGRAPDPHAVHAALLRTAAPCSPEDGQDCRRCLAGRLNVIESIALIRGGETTMSDADMVALSAISTPAEDTLSRDPPVSTSPAVPSVFDAAIRPSEAKARPIVLPTETAGVVPSCGVETKCACGSKETCSCGGGQKAALVYALGTLGYDFGSEARRDSLAQSMPSNANNPLLPDQLLGYLAANPYDAPSVIWTVNLDATPIYAVQPVGPYAAIGYERLREALSGQLARGVELVSVPGVIGGSVRLQSGQVVPVIVPSIRGIYCWATAPLVENVLGPKPKGADKQSAYERQSSGLSDFLNRVYYDLRNLGITAEERALNYSAVNAFQVAEVVRGTTLEELDLDKVNVKKSPVCRPDSDCYDVELLFFNPSNTNVANRVFRFTVDVSDVIPVTIGTVRSWTRRT